MALRREYATRVATDAPPLTQGAISWPTTVFLGEILLHADVKWLNDLRRDSGKRKRVLGTNHHDFEPMRNAAHRNGWRQRAISLIDTKLLKSEIARETYLRDATSFAYYNSLPHQRRAVESRASYLEGLKVMSERLAEEVQTRQLQAKRERYAREIGVGSRIIERGMQKAVGRYGPREGRVTRGVLKVLRNTADDVAAPVLIKDALAFLQHRGFHEEIQNVEASIRAFASRSLAAFAVDSHQIPRQKRDNHINRMLAPTTAKFLQNVYRTEGSVDVGNQWEKKAMSILPDGITPEMTDEMFRIYEQIGIMQRTARETNWKPKRKSALGYWDVPAFRNALNRIKKSSLLAPGGALALTPEFVSASSFRTGRGPMKNFHKTRPLMIVTAMDGLRDDVLNHIEDPTGSLTPYHDTRVRDSVRQAKEKNRSNRYFRNVNRTIKNRIVPKSDRPRVPAEIRDMLAQQHKKATQWNTRPRVEQMVMASDIRLARMFSNVMDRAQTGDRTVTQYMENIAAVGNATLDQRIRVASLVEGLFKYILNSMPKRDRVQCIEVGSTVDASARNMANRWAQQLKQDGLGGLILSVPQVPLDSEVVEMAAAPAIVPTRSMHLVPATD